MSSFDGEARTAFDFLLKTGLESPVPEIAESRFSEATGLVKYPFLAKLITMIEYDGLIAEIKEARLSRFKNLLVDTEQHAVNRRAEWEGGRN